MSRRPPSRSSPPPSPPATPAAASPDVTPALAPAAVPALVTLGIAHRRRLRELWRSAGWPCQDALEVDLLAAGLLERRSDDQGRETLRLSDAGVAELARHQQGNRARRDAHEDLVERVALSMQRAGRIVWRGLSLRALVPAALVPDASAAAASVESEMQGALSAQPNGIPQPPSPMRWAMAMPDVFSIRNTTVEHYVEPVVHEIKVSRGDLLGDLRNQAKRAAYLDLSSECWYVLREGIGDASDVPDTCGVIVATAAELQVLRPAPRRAMRPGFAMWMALAKARPLPALDDDAQALL